MWGQVYNAATFHVDMSFGGNKVFNLCIYLNINTSNDINQCDLQINPAVIEGTGHLDNQ